MLAVSNMSKIRIHDRVARNYMPGLQSVGLSSGFSTYLSTSTNITLRQNNANLNQSLDYLHTYTRDIQVGLDLTKVNAKARNAGVSLAWKYELEDIKMGGHGSIEGGWNDDEIRTMQERIEHKYSGVDGAEGHHQKNVAAHPEFQAEPDNIRFFRTRDEHRDIGHRGKWTNETDDPFINKDKMLRETNRRRNLKAEQANVKIVLYMAAGTGFLLGAGITLAMEGISIRTLKKAALQGGLQAIKSSAASLVGYGLGRVVGDKLTDTVVKHLVLQGINISEKSFAILNQTISGMVASLLFLSVSYIKLRVKGNSPSMALLQLRPALRMSLLGLTLSVFVSAVFRKTGGIIFSILWTIGQVAWIKHRDNHRKEIIRKLEYFRLEHSMPIYVEGTVV